MEPRFEQLNGQDPVEYILAVNVARRYLTTGHPAMAMALAYPNVEQVHRGKKASGSGRFPDVTKQRLSDARSLLEHEDLVGQVLAGAIRLDAARTEADRRRWKYLKEP
ncbi:hypothetical protein [Mesorhizobium sp. WSM2561]|uniref:hypothetical protein n=1 Tax=Mesorhizobium sp. WSM2561 TaxID=1040985 RepID=UPI00048488AE|nr:hypothetical protein [Mesorhizobium sp. WSM2561]